MSFEEWWKRYLGTAMLNETYKHQAAYLAAKNAWQAANTKPSKVERDNG